MPIVTIGPNNADDFEGMEDSFVVEDDPTGVKDGNGDVSVGKYDVGMWAQAIFRFLGLSNITGPVVVNEVRLYGSIEFMGVNPGHTLSARRSLRNIVFEEATWLEYSTGNAWATPGAQGASDRVSTISGQLVLTGSESGYVYLTGEGMAEDVQAWINGDLPNLGWVLERTDGANDETFFAFTASTVGNPDGSLPYLYVDYEVGGAPGGDMTAVLSFGVAVSGTLTGRGRLTGTRAMTLGLVSNIDGRGRLATTMPATFAVSASIDGRGRITTTAPMVFSVAAALDASGELATSVPVVFNLVGNLDGRAPMTSVVSFAFSVAGELTGSAEGFMTMDTGATFALAGDLAGAGELATSVPVVFNLVGNLDGRAPMTAAAAFAFGVSGDLDGSAPGFMVMNTGVAFSLAGTLRAGGRVATVAPMSLALSGALRGAGELPSASIGVSFSLAGDLIDLPDIAEMTGNMEAAFGWLAELLNTGQGTPIEVTAATFRAKVRIVAMTGAQYLDKYYNFAKTRADVHVVRVSFADGTRLDLPLREYERLYATEQAGVSNAGVSVSVTDERDGRY